MSTLSSSSSSKHSTAQVSGRDLSDLIYTAAIENLNGLNEGEVILSGNFERRVEISTNARGSWEEFIVQSIRISNSSEGPEILLKGLFLESFCPPREISLSVEAIQGAQDTSADDYRYKLGVTSQLIPCPCLSSAQFSLESFRLTTTVDLPDVIAPVDEIPATDLKDIVPSETSVERKRSATSSSRNARRVKVSDLDAVVDVDSKSNQDDVNESASEEGETTEEHPLDKRRVQVRVPGGTIKKLQLSDLNNLAADPEVGVTKVVLLDYFSIDNKSDRFRVVEFSSSNNAFAVVDNIPLYSLLDSKELNKDLAWVFKGQGVSSNVNLIIVGVSEGIPNLEFLERRKDINPATLFNHLISYIESDRFKPVAE